MPKYRRYFELGCLYFLTLVTKEREKVFSDSQVIRWFEDSLASCGLRYPHRLHAWVYIPDHIHLILEHLDKHTPADLVRCVKRNFLIRARTEPQKRPRLIGMLVQQYGTIWQSRYYDHVIRDEPDFARHADYIHFNPVKHGYVRNPFSWDHSSIHKYRYADDWGKMEPTSISGMQLE